MQALGLTFSLGGSQQEVLASWDVLPAPLEAGIWMRMTLRRWEQIFLKPAVGDPFSRSGWVAAMMHIHL